MIDPKLRDYASPRQLEVIDAAIRLGTIQAAADEIGITRSTASTLVCRVREKAARRGYAPGHFESGVAPGNVMGKVTIQRNALGLVERTWERQSPEDTLRQEAIREAYQAAAEELPRLAPVPSPVAVLANLCNLYTLTDCHVGMLAWHKEGGHDWDVSIAERTLLGCFEQMVAQSPAAETCVVNQLGDFLHYDGLASVTPTSGHLLDAEGRFSKMVAAAIRILRRIVDMALSKHRKVILVLAEGNHDLASSVWLRMMFAALYENEPRVQVIDSELPYYVHVHGRTMLAFHHGHLKKNDQLPLLFAAQFSTQWGSTTKRYAHCGHRHHEDVKEHPGMKVVQHPTLAARDAHAARGGWMSERQATVYTYHSEHGQVGSVTVVPEMLDAAA